MSTFASLGLAEPVLRALTAENYTIPTPIQAQAIPHVMAGKDVLGCAQTGTGKTAAFALPILHRLSELPADAKHAIDTLVLAPTRELAVQIAESFDTYGRFLKHDLHMATVFGGVSQHRQVQALKHGLDIVVATPGRLEDLMQQGYVDLRQIKTLVLDEADRMLDMGFIQPIRRIVAKMPKSRQTLFFSATMPEEIRRLASSILNQPVNVAVTPVASTAEKIDQSVFFVDRRNKPALLSHLFHSAPIARGLVFVRTKHGADRVVRHLNHAGIRAEAIHGNKSQNARQRALENFRSGKTPLLIASDIAARGIDVDGVTHVVNYDLTHEPETYVHRIGRTARAGASGAAISFCDSEEKSNLRGIERLIRQTLTVRTDHPDYSIKSDVPEPREDREDSRQGGGDRGGHRRGDSRSGGGRHESGRREGGHQGGGRHQGGNRRGDQRQSSDRPSTGRSHGPSTGARPHQPAASRPQGDGHAHPKQAGHAPRNIAGPTAKPKHGPIKHPLQKRKAFGQQLQRGR